MGKFRDKLKGAGKKLKGAGGKVRKTLRKAPGGKSTGDWVEGMSQNIQAEREKPGSFGMISSDYMGYIKAFFRTVGYIFIALGTFLIFGPAPLLKFIPLVILSAAIVTNPYGSASDDMEVGLSVLNMLLGLLMVAFFLIVCLRWENRR